MIAPGTPIRLAAFAALALLASCGGDPYVKNANEFNRQSSYYLEGVRDRESVTVCYAKRRTTAAEVRALAVDECGRFGKVAVFSETSYAACPLNTPVAAVYACTGGS